MAAPFIVSVIFYIYRLIRGKIQGVRISAKKQLLTALMGFGCAVGIYLLFLTAHTATIAITAKNAEELNAEQVYTEYITEYPTSAVYGIDINNPTESEYIPSKLRTENTYCFETNENGLIYKNTATVSFVNIKGKWEVGSINTDKDLENATVDLTATFTGKGNYSAIISLRDYLFTIDIKSLTKEGGTADITVYDETDRKTIDAGTATVSVSDISFDLKDNVIVDLTFRFSSPLGGSISTLTGEYSVSDATMIIEGFFYNDEIDFSMS